MYIEVNNKKIALKEANNFYKSFMGFMFKKNIDYVLMFKTNAIHTFFMKEEIDVIQTDKNLKIIRYYKNFKKNRIILPKKNIYYTFELPKDTINNLNLGDKLKIY